MTRLLALSIFIICWHHADSKSIPDTVTHWHVKLDSEIVLQGNVASSNAMLPTSKVDLTDDFDLMIIDIKEDIVYEDKKNQKIVFLHNGNEVFRKSSSSRFEITKSELLEVIKNGEMTLVLKYSDNHKFKEGLLIGQILFKRI